MHYQNRFTSAAFWMLSSTLLFLSMPANADTYHWVMPKPGQPICNSAFPGALKVCHAVGTAPAGVVLLGKSLQLAILAPFSTWNGVTAKKHPKIVVFHGNRIAGALTGKDALPFFQSINRVTIVDLADGGYRVIINAWNGGNNAHSNETFILLVTTTGRLALQSEGQP